MLLLITFGFTSSACSRGTSSPPSRFPPAWNVVCQDDTGDTEETANLGAPSGYDYLNSAADIEEVVLVRPTGDAASQATMIEVQARIRGDRSLPAYLELNGGTAQGQAATQSLAIRFTPSEPGSISTSLIFEVGPLGASGRVEFIGGDVARGRTFNVSYESGSYKAVVPILDLPIGHGDQISVQAAASWFTNSGINYLAMDETESCTDVTPKLTS